MHHNQIQHADCASKSSRWIFFLARVARERGDKISTGSAIKQLGSCFYLRSFGARGKFGVLYCAAVCDYMYVTVYSVQEAIASEITAFLLI